MSKVIYDSYQTNNSVNESYVINALSFSEAEAVLLRFLAGKGSSVTVKAMKPKDYENVLNDNSSGESKWYEIKVEETAGESSSMTFLILAKSIEDAVRRIKTNLKDYSVDFSITKVEQTKIISVLSFMDEMK